MATEFTTISTPATSKINWANGVAFVASVLAIFGFDLSPALQVQIVTGIALVLPLINMVLRTFFTAKT